MPVYCLVSLHGPTVHSFIRLFIRMLFSLHGPTDSLVNMVLLIVYIHSFIRSFIHSFVNMDQLIVITWYY